MSRSRMFDRHPSIASITIHQLRSYNARHCIQIGAETSRKWVDILAGCLNVAWFLKYETNRIVVSFSQMKTDVNEIFIRTAIYQIQKIYHKISRMKRLIGQMIHMWNRIIIDRTNRSTYASNVLAQIWIHWNGNSYDAVRKQRLRIWRNLWRKKY